MIGITRKDYKVRYVQLRLFENIHTSFQEVGSPQIRQNEYIPTFVGDYRGPSMGAYCERRTYNDSGSHILLISLLGDRAC
jgi:hypothetical protein